MVDSQIKYEYLQGVVLLSTRLPLDYVYLSIPVKISIKPIYECRCTASLVLVIEVVGSFTSFARRLITRLKEVYYESRKRELKRRLINKSSLSLKRRLIYKSSL